MSEPLFLEDPYLKDANAFVVHVRNDGGIILDRSIFYATSGGQPGDAGLLRFDEGASVAITTTIKGEDPQSLVLIPADGEATPEPGMQVSQSLDWDRRYAHMRMHTALHLLSVVLPHPVTGGSIGATESRLDFDIPDATLDKAEITEKLAALIDGDHAVSTAWISDEELEANPGLVKTMSVQPPKGAGRVRLVKIGDIDLQPCGGTHVATTREIGEIHVGKIEKKGRQNRRVRLRFGPMPS
ncbi:MAG: alanyl-tRNA editing protein [Pseudomonadota bacterium]